MRRFGIRCASFLVGLMFAGINMHQAEAQELRMRQRSGWNGSGSGQPSQKWTPGVEQQEHKRQEDVLRGWQEAERRSAETRVTPEHVLRDLQAKIQQTHSVGDYGTEAATWNNLAQTIQSAGFAPYARGIDRWSCYRGEVLARVAHIKQVQHRDVGTEMDEWAKVRPLAIQLASREPANAQWPFLEGMSHFKSGPGSFNLARQRLNKSMSMPGCQREIRGACELALSQMTAEEERLRALAKAAEERAARQRERQAQQARERQKEDVEKNRLAKALESAKDAIGRKQSQEAVSFLNQIIDAKPRNCPDILGSAYMFRAIVEDDRGQYQQAVDDCIRAQAAGRDDSLVQQIKRQAQAHLHRQ